MRIAVVTESFLPGHRLAAPWPDLARTLRAFPPGSSRRLQMEVVRLAGDPARRAALWETARRCVEGRDWESVGAELVGHYRELLA